MNTDLAVVERNLQHLSPVLGELLVEAKLPPARLIRTVMISLEKTRGLHECEMGSIMSAATTAAVLGLEVDGVTGQGYLIPFKQKAQFVIGYKGFNTMGARSGYTINAGVVRHGDAFSFSEGSKPFVDHIPSGGPAGRTITHAWACAVSKSLPPIVKVLTLEEIMFTKSRSQGARKADSPWNEPLIGFPAMAEKTARRRLQRSMPLNVMQLAGAFDDKVDEGRHTIITPDRNIVASEPIDVDPDQGMPLGKPPSQRIVIIAKDGNRRAFDDIESWELFIVGALPKLSGDGINSFIDRMEPVFDDLQADHPEHVGRVKAAIAARIAELSTH